MNHQELKAFTHKELSFLKHIELSEDKIVLLAKYRNSEIALTEDARLKLYKICNLLRDTISENPKTIVQKLKTIGGAISFFITLLSSKEDIESLVPDLLQVFNNFCSFLKDFIS